MNTPLIYTTCDQKYFDLHGEAFRNSAERHGHKVKIDIVKVGHDSRIRVSEERIHYCAARFTRLPELLERYSSILIVDVDSVFNSHIGFDDQYDLGFFFRPWVDPSFMSLQVLCAASYWTYRARDFAVKVRERIYKKHFRWMFDQKAIWETYLETKGEYNVLTLDKNFLNYDFDIEAPIWTGKGDRKNLPIYLERKQGYELRAAS